jgi:hypothetical protein
MMQIKYIEFNAIITVSISREAFIPKRAACINKPKTIEIDIKVGIPLPL